MRLRYSKLLNDIGTRVNFFSLRYSTAGFYTLSDTTYKGMAGGAPKQTVEDDGTVTTHYDTVYNLHMSRKAKNQLLLSQPMGEYGALSLSGINKPTGIRQKPRKVCSSRGTRRFVTCRLASAPSVALACTTTRKTISSRCPCRCRWVTRRCRPVSVYRYPCGSAGTTASTGVSGYLPGQENLFYSVNQRYSAQQHYGGDAALQYEGAWGDYNTGYSYAGDSATSVTG